MSQNGNAIIRPTPDGGRFFEPIKAKGEHRCPLPQQWTKGTLWQCPEGHLWVVGPEMQPGRGGYYVVGLAWWPATWRQRRKYGPGMKRADLSMASEASRVQTSPKPSPPKGPSGVSLSRFPPPPSPIPPPPPPPYSPGGLIR